MKKLFWRDVLLSRRTVMTALSVLLVVAMLLLGIGLNALTVGANLYPDATPEGLYTLTEDFLKEVERVEDEITITFCAPPDVLLNNYTTRYVYVMAREIEKKMENVTVRWVNVREDPTAVQEYRTTSSTSIGWSHVIVSCDKRYRMLSAEAFWSTDTTTNRYFAFNGEYKMATVFLSITAVDRPTVYFTVGAGEKLYDPEKTDDPENERYRAFYQLLLDEGLNVGSLNLYEDEIPSDCVLLVMNAPTADYAVPSDSIFDVDATPPIEKLDRYLDNHGSFMLFKDPGVSMPDLEEYLLEWGIKYQNGVTVKEPHSGLEGAAGEDLRSVLTAVYPTSEADPVGYSLFGDVAGLTTAPRLVVKSSGCLTSAWADDTLYFSNNVSAMTSAVFYSSAESRRYDKDGFALDEKGASYALARVTARVYADEVRDYYSYVFCAASTAMIESEYLDNPTYANYDVLFSTIRSISRTDEYASDNLGGLNMNSHKYGGKHLMTSEMTEVDTPVYEAGKVVRTYYGLTAAAKVIYTVIILLVPIAFLAYGTVRCVRRRYR